MNYLLCRVRINDFAAWKAVFDSHKTAHAKAGLKLINLMRGADDPNDLFILMEAADLAKARAFVTSPDVPDAKVKSGVVGQPEIYFLTS